MVATVVITGNGFTVNGGVSGNVKNGKTGAMGGTGSAISPPPSLVLFTLQLSPSFFDVAISCEHEPTTSLPKVPAE